MYKTCKKNLQKDKKEPERERSQKSQNAEGEDVKKKTLLWCRWKDKTLTRILDLTHP